MARASLHTALTLACCWALLGAAATSVPTYAAPPLPERKSDAIGSYDQKLEQTEAGKAELEKRAKEISSDLDGIQQKLVRLGTSIQKNEKEMAALDENIKALESEQTAIQSRLDEDRAAMADLIMALQRVRRLPPEALLAKPDAPLKTAQSAMLLQNTLPGLYEKAESLKTNLEKNRMLSQQLQDQRGKLTRTAQALQAEHANVSALAEKRQALYRSTQNDLEQKERESRKIAQAARNLKDLVQNLDEQRKRRETAMLAQKAAAATLAAPSPGSARLPISGIVTTRYNQPDHFGAPSQGIDIQGRGGALVVAPMGGVIRYAGAFRNYGEMVIIEHSDGYHSLVAGLEKASASVGQSVLSGEPLGTLHYANSSEKPVLYYELRYNGKAVDPARKFPDLS